MIALAKNSPHKREIRMSAKITTTSQTVETQLIRNGVIVDTKYHNNENQAINYVESHNVDSIEFEEIGI